MLETTLETTLESTALKIGDDHVAFAQKMRGWEDLGQVNVSIPDIFLW